MPAFIFSFAEKNTMEDLKSKVESLKDHVRDYVEDTAALAKLKAVKGASTAAATITAGIGVLVFAFFFFVFAGFGLAWWIGSLLDNIPAGFFIVAGFFL